MVGTKVGGGVKEEESSRNVIRFKRAFQSSWVSDG